MRIIYFCYGSAHSSICSAAIHLGRLPMDRVPTQQEVLSLSDYDQVESWQLGTLFYKGDDEWGHPVYTIGFGPEQAQAKQAVLSLLEQAGIDTSDLLLCYALPQINRWAKIGGALSRRYGLVSIGRPLSAFGIRSSYDRLVRFVHGVKEEEARRIRTLH